MMIHTRSTRNTKHPKHHYPGHLHTIGIGSIFTSVLLLCNARYIQSKPVLAMKASIYIEKLMPVNSGGKGVLAWPTKVDEILASAQPRQSQRLNPTKGRKFGDPLLICHAGPSLTVLKTRLLLPLLLYYCLTSSHFFTPPPPPTSILTHIPIAIMSVQTVETKPFQDQKPGT